MNLNKLLNKINIFYKLASASDINSFFSKAESLQYPDLLYAITAYKLMQTSQHISDDRKESLKRYIMNLCSSSDNPSGTYANYNKIATLALNQFQNKEDKSSLFKELLQKLRRVISPVKYRIDPITESSVPESSLEEEAAEEEQIALDKAVQEEKPKLRFRV